MRCLCQSSPSLTDAACVKAADFGSESLNCAGKNIKVATPCAYPELNSAHNENSAVVHECSDSLRSQPNESDMGSVHLPVLESRDWLVDAKCAPYLCREWESYQSCPRGASCWFIHCQSSWGSKLERIWERMDSHSLSIDQFEFKARLVTRSYIVQGRTLWIAGYKNVGAKKKFQEVYYAEGGPAQKQRQQDISFYASEEAAIAALKKVVAVSRFAARQGITTWGDGMGGWPLRLSLVGTRRKGETISQQASYVASCKSPARFTSRPGK